MRLAVEKTTQHADWSSCVIASDGRVLFHQWNYQKADRFSLDGKAISLPKLDESRLCASGTRFVFLGHPWEAGLAATAIILDGKSRREISIPRKGHNHHFLGCWLDGERLAIVASDGFHVVHGIGITEVKVATRAKQTPIAKVSQLNRHIGKGHAELSLQAVMRAGDRLFAIASAGYRYYALLELEPKAKSFGSRVVAHLKADQAVFSSGGQHAVFYKYNKTAQIVGLDGTKLATVTPKFPKKVSVYLSSAAPGVLAFSKRKGGVTIVQTSPWPGSVPGTLGDVPTSAAIADLDIDDARACSPEPVSYRGDPPTAFGAVTGWYLNADPAKKKPVITHAIVTDLIVNFFAATKGKLRLLFNFDLAAIDGVDIDGQRVTIRTPSGRTVLDTTKKLSAALAAAVKRRRPRR